MSLPPAIEKFRDNLQTEICNNLLEVEQLKSDLNLKGKGRRALDKNEISDIRRATLEHFNRGLVQRTDDFFREIEVYNTLLYFIVYLYLSISIFHC
jgi:hypothetical protein